MKYFDLVKIFVDSAFKDKGKIDSSYHFEQTVYWLKQLNPEADEAMLTAAYAHDIERAFRKETDKDLLDKKFNDVFYTHYHPQEGAKIIRVFLEQQGAPKNFIDKTAHLISGHELGGDDEQNLVKDADSMSFLEDQDKIDGFIARAGIRGSETIREKFDFMYNRLTSTKAREIAKPMYEEVLAKLKGLGK